MKKFISERVCYTVLIFFILSGECFTQGQGSDLFHLDSLGAKGIKLDKGWKFHAGDSAKWATPGYDDHHWQSVNPTLELHHLPEVKDAGIGWFRLKMIVDSSLFNENIAMVYTAHGASQVYLNGELLYKFGTVSSNYATERTRFVSYRPFSLKLGDQRLQELAVRYSFHKKNLYLNIGNPNNLQIILKENNRAFADYLRFEGFYQNIRSIQLSFYLPLGFLLLFLYSSYRFQKEYLYVGIFCFCMFLAMTMTVLGLSENRTANTANIYLLTKQGLSIVGLIALLNGIYILFKHPKSFTFYFIVSFAAVLFLSYFILHDWVNLLGNLFAFVVNVEFLRLSLIHFRRSRPGAVTLVVTGILCLLLTLGAILLGFSELGYFLLSVCFVLPPIGLSLFFAGEFARTGLSLRSRIAEVVELSEKTIAQEKEKQQILALQTETLEAQVREKTTELMEQRQALEAEKEVQLIAEFNRRFSESELKALRAQMNPHFIFNSLNSIDNLIQTEQKERATTYLAKFARLIRAILENSKHEVIPCWKDLETLQLYLELENLRWDKKFTTAVNIDQRIVNGDYKIPPMLVQPYVENAIHHGLLNKTGDDRKLQISVQPENGSIKYVIEDNGVGRAQAEVYNKLNLLSHQSMGMQITERRIQLFNHNENGCITIIDLFNDDQSPAGTRVEMFINNQG